MAGMSRIGIQAKMDLDIVACTVFVPFTIWPIARSAAAEQIV